jgi:hypothetical protein
VEIVPYRTEDAERWDRFLEYCWNATPLHQRRFLAYHGDRFSDQSLLVADGARLLGVFPAAVDPNHPATVVSHPGATYGGLVQAGSLVGEMALEALDGICSYYRRRGFSSLRYKAVPAIYHRTPYADDLYALFRLGARRWRTDLCAVIDLSRRLPLDRNRRAGLRRATAHGVTLDAGIRHLDAMWRILEWQLEHRFGARPTHTLAEMKEVADRLGDLVECRVAKLEETVVAGLVLFRFHPVLRAQYSAADPTAREVGALDLLFDRVIGEATANGFAYFDFGNSNTDEGQLLNAGLYRYKLGFGAGSVPHDMYEIWL